ncbi:unnamed protein product, partial [marine sediment metagenome]
EDVLVSEAGEWITRTAYEALQPEAVTPYEEIGEAFGKLFPEQDIAGFLERISAAGREITEGMHWEEAARIQLADKELEEFYDALMEIGRTDETEALLKQLGATEEDIGEFYLEALIPVAEEAPPMGMTETAWEVFKQTPWLAPPPEWGEVVEGAPNIQELMATVKAPKQWATKQGVGAEVPEGSDELGAMTAIEIGGGLTLVPVADIKNATRLLHNMIDTRIQAGSLSRLDLGTLTFPLSAV